MEKGKSGFTVWTDSRERVVEEAAVPFNLERRFIYKPRS